MTDGRPQSVDGIAAVRRRPSAVLPWLFRLFVLLLFVAWSITHLDGFSWDYDEGIHVYIAWLVQQGHPLYAQTFSPYTPGFIVALLAAFMLLGASVFAARLVTVLVAALGLLGVMIAASELAPSPVRGGGLGWGHVFAELCAAALLVFTPSFLQWSRAAMSDLPSAALTALAVALALVYLRAAKLRWLFAAEIIFAGALWVKLISIGGAAAIALAMWLSLRERRADIPRALLGSLIIVVLALSPLLSFDVRSLYDQAIYFHVQKRAAYTQSLLENFSTLIAFLGDNLTLSALALLGAVMGLANRNPAIRHLSLVASIWFVATFISLMLQTPLFANHHPVVLVFALASLAGAGTTFWILDIRYLISRFTPSLHHLTTAFLLLIALLGLGQYPEAWRAASAPPFQPVAEEAVTLLRALTPASDLLVSDAQMIAFRAQRQSPPALADTSQARLDSGNLTAQQLIAEAQQPNVNAILFWSGRLESGAAFVDWTERNYHRVRSSLQKPNAPYRFYLRAPHPQYALEAQLGDGIRLWGYDLNRRGEVELGAGQTLSLTLYFERIGEIPRSYTVFTHLLDAHGHVVAQADRPPLAGRYLTTQWQTNEFVVDEFVLPLDFEVSDGDYQLEIGMYLRETLQRLPITLAGVRQPDDRLLVKLAGTRAK